MSVWYGPQRGSEGPILALFGPAVPRQRCLLSASERTLSLAEPTSENAPQRTCRCVCHTESEGIAIRYLPLDTIARSHQIHRLIVKLRQRTWALSQRSALRSFNDTWRTSGCCRCQRVRCVAPSAAQGVSALHPR